MLDSEKIKDYLENPKKEYKVFNLGLSKKEKEVFKNFKLPKLKLAKVLHYSFNGNLKDMKDLNEFLSVLGDNSSENIEILENKIREIAKEVLSGFGEKCCWLNIRVSYKDNNNFLKKIIISELKLDPIFQYTKMALRW